MIDLHIHSHHSLDGEFSPTELIDQCHKKKLKYVALSDHNNVDAYKEAKDSADILGIHLIPAVEIDCYFENHPLHLLAYGLSPDIPELLHLCQRQLQLEIGASQERLAKINQLGFDLTLDDFDYLTSPVITPEDIAEVLLNHNDYPRHPLLLPYRKNGMRGDNPLVNFYWDYFSAGKPCYVKLDYPKIETVLDLINKHKGISILAHPGATFRENFELIGDIMTLGVQGLEVFSSYHSHFDVERLVKLCQSNNLLMTAGSDYHGKIKPTVKLGDIDYYEFKDLFQDKFNLFIDKLNI